MRFGLLGRFRRGLGFGFNLNLNLRHRGGDGQGGDPRHVDCDLIWRHLNIVPKDRGGRRGRTKKRFARELIRGRCGDKGDGVKAVLGREPLGLAQGLLGQNGHLGHVPVQMPVKHQLINAIGRAPVQCRADFGALCLGVRRTDRDRGIEDLAFGNDQFRRDPAAAKFTRCAAQQGQRFGHLRIVQLHGANHVPTAIFAVQQVDPIMRQV